MLEGRGAHSIQELAEPSKGPLGTGRPAAKAGAVRTRDGTVVLFSFIGFDCLLESYPPLKKRSIAV